jgi:hypothetical protein
MKVTEHHIEFAHIFGQLDEIADILKGVTCPRRRLELRYKKAEITGDFWRLKQDAQRSKQSAHRLDNADCLHGMEAPANPIDTVHMSELYTEQAQ